MIEYKIYRFKRNRKETNRMTTGSIFVLKKINKWIRRENKGRQEMIHFLKDRVQMEE